MTSSEATDELAAKLQRRQKLNAGEEVEPQRSRSQTGGSISLYHQNNDMPKKTIDDIKNKFKEFDLDKNGLLDVYELTLLFEKLKAPQTRSAINQMIADVDKDNDGCVNLEEFIQLFRQAASDQFDDNSIFRQLAALAEVDVSQVGVKGARDFFAAKSKQAQDDGSMAAEIERERAEAKERERLKQEKHEKMKELKKRFETQ